MPSEKRARQRAAREARLAAEAKRQQNRKRIRNGILIVAAAGLVVGLVFALSRNNNTTHASQSHVTTTTNASHATNARLQAQANSAAVAAGCPAGTSTRVNNQKYATAPAMTIDTRCRCRGDSLFPLGYPGNHPCPTKGTAIQSHDDEDQSLL